MFPEQNQEKHESKWKLGAKALGLGAGIVGGGVAGGFVGPMVYNVLSIKPKKVESIPAVAGAALPKPKISRFEKDWAASDKHWRHAKRAKGSVGEIYHKFRSYLAAPHAKLGIGLGAVAGGLGTYGAYRLGKYFMSPSSPQHNMTEGFWSREMHDEKLNSVLKKAEKRRKVLEFLDKLPKPVKYGVGVTAIGAGGYGLYRGAKYLKKKWDGRNTKESLALHVLNLRESGFNRGNLQEIFEPGGMAAGALKTAGGWVKKKLGKGTAKALGHAAGKVLPYAKTAEGAVQGVGKFALGSAGFEAQQKSQQIANRLTGVGESDFNKGNLTEGPIKISNKMFKNALTSRYAKTVAFGKAYPSFQGSYGPSSSIDRVKKGIIKLGNKDEELKRVAKLKKLVNLKTRVGWNVHRAQAQMESSSILANRSLKEYGDYNSYDYANNHPALENPFNRPAPLTPYVPAEAPSNFVRHLKTAGKVALALGVVAGGLGAARAVTGRYGARKGLEAFAKTVSENPNWASPKLAGGQSMFANKKEMLDKLIRKAKKMPSYSGEVWRGIKTGVFNPLKTVKGSARDVENMLLGNY